MRGTDHWRARLPRVLGLDVVANHGLAIGDVNGDLLDDLYLCMQGGLPNRLYLRNPDGTLGRQADHVLTLPDAPEACGIGMAPTTSTTCTLVLGDALAVASMRLRGFEKENYLAFHDEVMRG